MDPWLELVSHRDSGKIISWGRADNSRRNLSAKVRWNFCITLLEEVLLKVYRVLVIIFDSSTSLMVGRVINQLL
jgi:hypothetical protein